MKFVTLASFALAVSALLATPALSAGEPRPIRICTGGETGAYYDAGKTIAKWSKQLKIEVIETEGSLDNLEQIEASLCDVIIAQPDALNNRVKESPAIKKLLRPVGALHREYLHVLCNRETGYDNLADLEGTKAKLNIGPPGSGSWITWQNIVAEDDGYSSIETVSDMNDLALSSVSSGDTDCMLVTSALNSGFMQSADSDYGDIIMLVGANDKDFNDAVSIDGKALYTKSEISAYPNINNGWSNPDTISWNAQVYANVSELDNKTLSKIVQAVSKARSEIISRYGK